MALGAFMAGMMLSETEFRHQIEADIRPFRDVLLGLFFITIGMLLNIPTLLPDLHWVLFAAFAIIVIKTIATMVMSILIMKASRGVALRTGMVLAQGGEFGFALLSLALAAGLMEAQASQLVLASVIFTMMLTPFLIRYNGWAAKHFYASYGRSRQEMEDNIKTETAGVHNHVIICGFGHMGQNIAKIIAQEGYPYFALDYNINIIQEAKNAGYKVYFGDSTHKEILHAAGIDRA